MSQYHYDDEFSPSKEERDRLARIEAEEEEKRKKQRTCKHVNSDPPSGGGYGYCNDCGAIL